jgi:hypothetical protein
MRIDVKSSLMYGFRVRFLLSFDYAKKLIVYRMGEPHEWRAEKSTAKEERIQARW